MSEQLPECDPIVISVFMAMRMRKTNGMGSCPIDWIDIDAYCRVTQTQLSKWEVEQVINMSNIYCAWVIKGESASCVSPWGSDSESAIEHNRKLINDRMKAMRANRKAS